MNIFEVETKRGDKLFGCLYGEEYKETCVIITNGNCGNIFENKFLRDVGEELEKNKIAFIYAHNSGAFHRMDSTKSGMPYGNTYELFDNCLDDLQAYIDYAKEVGYKNIVLGGHSYGANKVIYYLSQNQNEDIGKYILISPVDMTNLKDRERLSVEKLMPIAIKFQNEDKLDELLPFEFDETNFYTARAFLDFVNNKNAKNLPIYSQKGDFSQLKSINQIGLFVMGEKDSYAKGDTLNHLQIINENSKYQNNVVKVINDCGHTFKNKSSELAKEILDFLKI